MEIRQLEYVVGVVDEGGFTRAAGALHVTQPALSEGIRRLEAELGVELFHRVGRRALLSAAGEAFVEPARQVLRDLGVLRTSVAAVAGVTAGTLDVVALPTLAVDPLAELVGAFRHAHPEVVVRVDQPEDAAAVATLVRSGRSEIGLTELPVAEPGLVSRQLTEQELLVVLPPASPLGGRRRLTTADLASVPLVTSPPGTSTRGLIDAAFAAIDAAPVIAVETDQREAIVPLVVAGAGASILPRPQAEAAAVFGATTVSLTPRMRRSIGLIWRDGPLSPAARAFVNTPGGVSG
jgi:LysR family transcriptional regulator, carnitine catabolism transcriptional activator